ncbi:hypothetical protein CYLTODRAFT_453073 [Cylindrobasidium torrendii FP15055 ss-10]|uniref:Uncharacterized protein n=1 Tax=Cylindrobasidium torrendii FP15055 ss-10 TaxID=1314674 RepID=A0A0D7BH07_9AGAR|nr:hypothetical protein CYLTODRAFT_453073 [Cylindrobasidium torrendii FP15055 ss-10]
MMAPIYLPKHISRTPHFNNPVMLKLFDSLYFAPAMISRHAHGLGISETELKEWLDCAPWIEVDESMRYFLAAYSALVPCEEIFLRAIMDLYMCNYTCQWQGGFKRFYLQNIQPSVTCRLVASLTEHLRSPSDAIYVTHPITGEVSKHIAPYNTLPDFKLPRIHPCLLIASASNFNYYDNYSRLRDIPTCSMELFVKNKAFYNFQKAYGMATAPIATESHRRKWEYFIKSYKNSNTIDNRIERKIKPEWWEKSREHLGL